MNMKETTYQSPKVEVIDICAESIICASGEGQTETYQYGDTEDWF